MSQGRLGVGRWAWLRHLDRPSPGTAFLSLLCQVPLVCWMCFVVAAIMWLPVEMDIGVLYKLSDPSAARRPVSTWDPFQYRSLTLFPSWTLPAYRASAFTRAQSEQAGAASPPAPGHRGGQRRRLRFRGSSDMPQLRLSASSRQNSTWSQAVLCCAYSSSVH